MHKVNCSAASMSLDCSLNPKCGITATLRLLFFLIACEGLYHSVFSSFSLDDVERRLASKASYRSSYPKTKSVFIPSHFPYSAAAVSGLSYFKVALLHLQNSCDTKANSDTLLYFYLFRTQRHNKSQSKAKVEGAGIRERRWVNRFGVTRMSVILMQRNKIMPTIQNVCGVHCKLVT